MPAPVQMAGSPFQTAWTDGVDTKTIAIGAVAIGDLFVIMGVTEDSVNDMTTPTNSAGAPATLTFTARGTVTTGSRTRVETWTAVVTGAGDLTVSSSAPGNWGYAVWGFASADHGGVGQVPAGAHATTGAPSVTATWAANSLVACVMGDWTATADPARDYRTNLGAATEVNYANVDGNYSTMAWYHADSGSGGSTTVGMNTPTSGITWSLVAIEVLGTVSAEVPVGNRLRRWQY